MTPNPQPQRRTGTLLMSATLVLTAFSQLFAESGGRSAVAPAATAADLALAVSTDTRDVPPGGTVAVQYLVTNFAPVADRFRFAVDDTGWTIATPRGTEMLEIAAGGDLEGAVYLRAPAGARVGDLQRVRVVVDSPSQGTAEAFVTLRIAEPGTRTDVVQLPFTMFIGGAGWRPAGVSDPRLSMSVDGATAVSRRTRASWSFARGPRQDTPAAYRVLGMQPEPRLRVDLINPSWNASAGELLSRGGTLTGAFARGNGVTLRRTAGRLIGGVIVGRPTDLGRGAARGGHIAQASAGVSVGSSSFSFVASDLARPGRPLPRAPVVDAGTTGDHVTGDLEQLAQLFPQQNRVRGIGVQSTIASRHHRLNVEAGRVVLSDPAGRRSSGPAHAVHYGLATERANVTVESRRMPSSLPGVYIPGDSVSVDGNVVVAGDLRLTARRSSTTSWLFAEREPSRAAASSVGLRYGGRGAVWADLQANAREWRFAQTSRLYSAATSVGARIAGLTAHSGFELGVTETGGRSLPAVSHRSSVNWSTRATTLSASGSYSDEGQQPSRVQLDLRGSVGVGDWRIEGGGGITRGGLLGAQSLGWVNVDAPVARDLCLVTGVEFVDWRADAGFVSSLAPVSRGPWAVTLGIRQKLSIPLPFLRNPAASFPMGPSPSL